MALVGSALGGWLATHLDGFQWDNDEGILASVALAVRHGEPLYTRVYSDLPPGLTLVLAAVFARFGPNVEAGRLACLLLALVGAIGVAVLARRVAAAAATDAAPAAATPAAATPAKGVRFWSSVAGVAAFALLALSPHFFWLSRSINPDLPQMALGVWAMVAFWVYRDGGGRRWLVLGAACWALSQWFKLSGVLLILPLALLVIQRRRMHSAVMRTVSWRSLIGDVLLAASVAAILLAGWLLVAPAPAVLDNVVGSLTDAARVYPNRAGEYASWVFLENLFGLEQNLGLTLLALAGLGWLWRRGGSAGRPAGFSNPGPWPGRSSRSDALVLALWWAGTVLGVIVQRPMWPKHHWSFLLWPMAVLAGVGFAAGVRALVDGVANLRRRPNLPATTKEEPAKPLPLSLLLVALLIAWTLTLPAQAAYLADHVAPSRYNSARESVAWLQANTPADAIIVTDTGLIPFRAGRRGPPELAVVSSKRNRTGRLSGAQLIAITERDQAAAVVIWNSLLTDFDDYKAYLRERYVKVVEDDGRTIWQRKAPGGAGP